MTLAQAYRDAWQVMRLDPAYADSLYAGAREAVDGMRSSRQIVADVVVAAENASATISAVEERAAALGHRVLNLDVRETQAAAIQIFEALGFTRWGTHPAYARVRGQIVAGHFYHRMLEAPRRKGQ